MNVVDCKEGFKWMLKDKGRDKRWFNDWGWNKLKDQQTKMILLRKKGMLDL